MPTRVFIGKDGYSAAGGVRSRREKMPVPAPGSRTVRPRCGSRDVEPCALARAEAMMWRADAG